jgi:hypothetical protein
MRLILLAVALLLCGCGEKDAAAPARAPDVFDPDHVVINETPECSQALQVNFGLTNRELWVMTHDPVVGICPNAGVTEARIREIAALWDRAPCHKHTPAEMLHALDTHACGGDAG